MNTKKVIRFAIIGVVLLIILAIVGKQLGWFGKAEILNVAVEKVQSRTITEVITANGKLQPETEVKISPDVSGEIVELHVMEGDEVKAGQLLLKIKPDIYQSNLERMKATVNSSRSNSANSEARLAQVKAQFIQAELSYKRSEKLWKERTISESEFETAQANYATAKAEVDAAQQSVSAAKYQIASAEASLKEANENLMKTTIYAPMDGIVSMLNVEKGERVVGTMQMAGTEIMRIANLDVMEVIVDVNENDIIRVKLGDTALIEVDAYLKDKFKGSVTEIANSANVSGLSTDQVTNFEVKIRVLKESYQHLLIKGNNKYFPFRPGMSATVDIQTNTKPNVLSVPIQAVTTRADSTGIVKTENKDIPEGFEEDSDEKKDDKKADVKLEQKEVVFVYKDGKVKQREVKTGIQDTRFIEILEGLEKDEEVVSAPFSIIAKKLKNDANVKKVKEEELFKAEKEK